MLTSLTFAASSSATTVPGPPSGWTTTYSDSFSGAAGSGVNSGWAYDTGTQYNGTGCTAQYGDGRGGKQHQVHRERVRGRQRAPEHHPGQLGRVLDLGADGDRERQLRGPGGR